MATTTQWVAGARLRTLPPAIAPVVIGTGAAIGIINTEWETGTGPAPYTDSPMADPSWGWDGALRALLALVVALALQVGVNYANDYSDGIRGTDDDRVGPFRLTGSRRRAPVPVKTGGLRLRFGVAGVAGLALVALSAAPGGCSPSGRPAILAAWYYTGGRRPYGYAGLGEVFVFVFFGLVAVLGTTYTQVGRVSPHPPWPARSASAPWPAPSWWRTTCATSRPTRSQASAPWPSGWATPAPGGSSLPWSQRRT